MNASEIPEPVDRHRLCLSLGSNIDPAKNIRSAVALLREFAWDLSFSACYETEAVGTTSANFYNMAVCLLTHLTAPDFKQQVVSLVESRLGRRRTKDKYAPRTIDLDIVIADGEVLDPQLWQQVYLALPLSELLPDLIQPETGQSLLVIAQKLRQQKLAVLRPEVSF